MSPPNGGNKSMIGSWSRPGERRCHCRTGRTATREPGASQTRFSAARWPPFLSHPIKPLRSADSRDISMRYLPFLDLQRRCAHFCVNSTPASPPPGTSPVVPATSRRGRGSQKKNGRRHPRSSADFYGSWARCPPACRRRTRTGTNNST